MANSVNRYFEGVLVGGALGFIAGLLTAPKPGAELRRELADSTDDMLKQANEQWLDVKDKMGDRVQPLADKATVYKDRAMTQATALRSRVNEKTCEIKEQIKPTLTELKGKADELRVKAEELKGKAAELKDKAVEKAGELKEKASELKDKVGTGDGGNGADLMNNYMGNNSGPVYTAGAKVSPDASATTPVSDACSNYSAGKAEGGAADA